MFAATFGSGAVGLAACRECSDPRAAASWAFDHTCRPSAESRASAVTWQPRPEPGGAFFAVVQDATLSLWCLAPRCAVVSATVACTDSPKQPLGCSRRLALLRVTMHKPLQVASCAARTLT